MEDLPSRSEILVNCEKILSDLLPEADSQWKRNHLYVSSSGSLIFHLDLYCPHLRIALDFRREEPETDSTTPKGEKVEGEEEEEEAMEKVLERNDQGFNESRLEEFLRSEGVLRVPLRRDIHDLRGWICNKIYSKMHVLDNFYLLQSKNSNRKILPTETRMMEASEVHELLEKEEAKEEGVLFDFRAPVRQRLNQELRWGEKVILSTLGRLLA